MIFAAIPYLLTQARALFIAALGDPLMRTLIIAFALLMGLYALKAHWQAGLVPRAEIEAATHAAQTDATATRAVIEQQRTASEQADAAALARQAAEMERARNAWKTSSDPVVLPAGDGWLRVKAGSGGH
jgi:hypothetical protein